MSMAYIRQYYGVPAKRGARVRFTWPTWVRRHGAEGSVGTIVAAKNQYLRVRFDADPTRIFTLHPTWEVEYAGGVRFDV